MDLDTPLLPSGFRLGYCLALFLFLILLSQVFF
jgi:hypothetical protein